MEEVKTEVLTVCNIERAGNDRNGNAKYKVYLYLPFGFTIASCKAQLDCLPYNQRIDNWYAPHERLVKYQVFNNFKVKVYSIKNLDQLKKEGK